MNKLFVTVDTDKEKEFLEKWKAGQIDEKKVVFVNGEKSSYIVVGDHVYADQGDLVDWDEYTETKSLAGTALQPGTLATINNQSIEDGGNISVDLSIYRIVDALPDEDIDDNKIYLVKDAEKPNTYVEYHYKEDGWHMIGERIEEVSLDGYLTEAAADQKYLKASNGNSVISISSNGMMSNTGDNGQAYNAVREVSADKSVTGSTINSATFGVKLDGTAAFTHKTYATFNANTGANTGACNTAVLTWSGKSGLRYAKNSASSGDVKESDYRYVGVIDSPDAKQKVYSAAQVDTLISKMKTVLTELGATSEQIASITL